MKNFFKDALFLLLVIVGIGPLAWLLTGNDLAMTKVFAPQYKQVRREVFERSKAYRDGVVQELQSMQFAYIAADPAHKLALASLIKHRAVTVPLDAMPLSLSTFIKELP